jgi:hypothetical protein
MNYTFGNLLSDLLMLSQEDLEKTATVLNEDEEFIGLASLNFTPQEDDVLDGDHPYLKTIEG